MAALIIWNFLLAVLLFPPVFLKLFKLEIVPDRWEGYSRWLIWLALTAVLITGLTRTKPAPPAGAVLLVTVFAVLSLEVLSRAAVIHGAVLFPGKRLLLQRIQQKLGELSMYGVFVPRFEPHPFLHFTLKRRSLGDGNAEMGFIDLTVKDIPKPPGTIRVACLGNSTAVNYPRHLQAFLDTAAPQTRFQVLNFAMGWWSSVHSTVNFILNVIDFKPDVVVLNDNCNDHNYRGYPGLRGDCAHAYQPLVVPPSQDLYWSRLSVLYRIAALVVKRRYPKTFARRYSAEKSLLLPGKGYQYEPGELNVFERNLDTIHAVSAHRGIRLCLMTHPFSNVMNYGEEHDKIYRPHMRRVNAILREKAVRCNLPLIEADLLMTGEESLFRDPVHVDTEGEMIKAYLIGGKILEEMSLPILVGDGWRETADWVANRSSRIGLDAAQTHPLAAR